MALSPIKLNVKAQQLETLANMLTGEDITFVFDAGGAIKDSVAFTLDSALSEGSQNPVANAAITEAINDQSARVAKLEAHKGVSYLQACLSSDTKITKEGTYENPVILPFTGTTRSDGSGLRLGNNGVVIGAGVKKVRVSAQMYMWNSTALTRCEINVFISNADGTRSRHLRSITKRVDNYETISTSQIILPVTEGQTVQAAYVGKPDTTIVSYKDSTLLIVEVVEWED
jgi:hypothetical protein|nr:MAG TPA: hypothetical protein [Caudoviricetes sp.]